MPQVVRVRYEEGILRPLDDVEFGEGEELELMIVGRSFRGFRDEAGKYRFKVDRDIVEEFIEERR